MENPSSSSSGTAAVTDTACKTLLQLLPELQVHVLSYLRAYDLCSIQQTCKFYNDPNLIHKVVAHEAEQVYPPELTKGIPRGAGSSLYTWNDLRNIELTVVARLLSTPEPKSGYYVSKSWIKKTLLWLETQTAAATAEPPKKRLTKKQQRQNARRLSDVTPPWPNMNSDILCTHQNLQRCGVKSARSRRRLMNKQAWKILKKLYPDSTQLESVEGECLQCLVETETARKTQQDQAEQAKMERKKPLANPYIRRFYTRTRGVPTSHVVESTSNSPSPAKSKASTRANPCPLIAGTYHILPRAWCHKWRRYIKTGEGGMPQPPDSSALLCDAHRLALLPPHLEAYLYGETSQLLTTERSGPTTIDGAPICVPVAASASVRAPPPTTPVGVRPNMDPASVHALLAAGVPPAELASQQMAMLRLEQERRLQQEQEQREFMAPTANLSQNDLLDQQNHIVIEIVSHDEWLALQEASSWPGQHSNFCVSLIVDQMGQFSFSTIPCRDCDSSGSTSASSVFIKNRARSWVQKTTTEAKPRVPSLEY